MGKLFGGHIMRKAYELAYANVQLLAGSPVVPIGVDDIEFKAPVHIGSIFLMNSQVSYTDEDTAVARVYATVRDPYEKTETATNSFYFRFKTIDGHKCHMLYRRLTVKVCFILTVK